MERRTAAIVTVGTELTTGLRQDTNGGEIARRLRAAGYDVRRLTSVPDDEAAIADALAHDLATYGLLVVTGGLGPTHDDRTRGAAAHALGVQLVRDPGLAAGLEHVAGRHTTAAAGTSAFRQADVLQGAHILPAVTGTAPGQVFRAGSSELLLLPGPPNEMRPLLESFLSRDASVLPPRVLRCAGVTESDAGAIVGGILGNRPGIGFTLLATPSLVDVVIFDDGAGAAVVDELAADAERALGDRCYSSDGRSLAEVVVAAAADRGLLIACAESCTGGSVAQAITDVVGASRTFLGGVVSYADSAKTGLLGVPSTLLAEHGAVSEQTAIAMAEGVRARFEADLAISVTGIAGPGGGSQTRPVGLVWFGLARIGHPPSTFERRFHGDRSVVRARATVHALDLLRHAILEA